MIIILLLLEHSYSQMTGQWQGPTPEGCPSKEVFVKGELTVEQIYFKSIREENNSAKQFMNGHWTKEILPNVDRAFLKCKIKK